MPYVLYQRPQPRAKVFLVQPRLGFHSTVVDVTKERTAGGGQHDLPQSEIVSDAAQWQTEQKRVPQLGSGVGEAERVEAEKQALQGMLRCDDRPAEIRAWRDTVNTYEELIKRERHAATPALVIVLEPRYEMAYANVPPIGTGADRLDQTRAVTKTA